LVGGNKSSQCGKDLAVSKMVEGNTEPRNKYRRCPDPVPVFSCEVEDVSKARGVRIEKCMQGKREKNQQDLGEPLGKKEERRRIC
ncbi:hypothetical protein E2320_000581, partial [Naja naja]